jgi:hypothetical protein
MEPQTARCARALLPPRDQRRAVPARWGPRPTEGPDAAPSTAPVDCACRLRPSPAQAGPSKAGETSGPALGARGSPETSAALSRGWRRVHTKDLELPPPTSKPVDPSGWTVTRSQGLARKDQTLTSARNLAKAMFDALIQATPRPPRSTTQSWVAPDTPAMWKRISIGCATVAAQARGLSVSR